VYLWRISNHVDLSGRGGLLASGRWHEAGNPVVYCADHPSTALLEILVHVDLEDLPSNYTLLKIACPDELPLVRIGEEDVDSADLVATQALGKSMLESTEICLIEVGSVVMPQARNVLINPSHPAASKITIEATFNYPFDSRLLK